MRWTILVALLVLALPAAAQELTSEVPLAPLELFRHPPAGTLDPYSPFPCACHGSHCMPVPTDWDTGLIQPAPGGAWVDPYSLNAEKVFDSAALPGEYAAHASICRWSERTTCLFFVASGV